MFKTGSGHCLESTELISDIRLKMCKAEGKMNHLTFRDWCSGKDTKFTLEDAMIIGKVCDNAERCDQNLKLTVHCWRCVSSSLKPGVCFDCSYREEGNLPISFIQEGSEILEDIRYLKRYVDKEFSMCFI